MAGDDRVREVDELPVCATCVVPQHVEGGVLVDAVPLHQDPLRALGDGPSGEGSLEVVVLGEAPEDDVDGALHLLGTVAVRDVGEDAALGRLLDEVPILNVEHGDYRARRLVHDSVDQLEGFGGSLVHDDHRNVGTLYGRDAADVGERGLAGDDVVAERGDGASDLVEPCTRTVGDEDAQTRSAIGHLMACQARYHR
jgi:hypothetical protein